MVKTMNLTVAERLVMGALFPQKGSLRDMRISRDLIRKIRFTEEEKAAIKLVMEAGQTTWDSGAATELGIELNDDEREFLKRQVSRVDEEEGFTPYLFELAERIKEI